MTSIPPPAATPGKKNVTVNTTRSTARRDQLRAAALGVVLLAGSFLLQSPLRNRRNEIIVEPETPLRSLAVQFPRLTLGGFRGLLATILWIQAENDKNDHNWIQLETKYDIIGALQPYFVSVYIFHAWNQAYNLSAQWHTVDSKYKWVLDGLAYLYKGEEYNAQNPDILLEEGHLYFLKLGGAFERIFYRAHWRDDISRLHEIDGLGGGAIDDKTVALKHVRDFVLQPQFHTKPMPDPSGSTLTGWGVEITDPELFKDRADGEAADKPMPFRHGLSPYYFAYIEYRRCLAAGTPTTTGLNVIDAWPSMALRLWCRDDLFYSQQTMNDLFNSPEAASSATFNQKVLELRDCYRNVQMIAPRAVDGFEAHLHVYNGTNGKPNNEGVHRKHILETIVYQATGKAESALFEALVQWQKDNRKLTPAVIAKMSAAIPLYEDAILKSNQWLDSGFPNTPGQPPNPDRADFGKYSITLRGHIKGIEQFLKTPPDQAPDLKFLNAEIVER